MNPDLPSLSPVPATGSLRRASAAGAAIHRLGVTYAAALTLTATAAWSDTTPIAPGQSHYLESCGGCHGIEGASSPRDIPELRGNVGRFLCTQAGREYVVRLPNVAFADVDAATLAELLNFMMFKLSGPSLPPNAQPYTAAEVARLRTHPLKNQPLEKLRVQILVRASVQQCATSSVQTLTSR